MAERAKSETFADRRRGDWEIKGDVGRQWGCACITVDVVADGNAAIRASLEDEYDLILMDCQMPVLDGFDAIRAIRVRE